MEYITILVDYIEGRMDFATFVRRLNDDTELCRWIDKHVPHDWCCYTKATPDNNYKPEKLPYAIQYMVKYQLVEGNPFGAIYHQRNVFDHVYRILKTIAPEVSVVPDITITEKANLLIKACPSYIDGPEVWQSGILDRIIGECDAEWSKTQKAKHIRNRIREEFGITGNKYPHWISNPDWPFCNGKPMHYVKTTVVRKYEWIQHHFIDPDSGTERIIDDQD